MDYASQTQSQTQTRNSDLVIKMPRASRIGLNPDLILRSEVIQILTESLKDYKMTERVEGRTWRLAQNVGAEPLVFNVTLYDIEGAKIRLLDFARQRGDSVLFRKVFASLRKKFSKFTGKFYEKTTFHRLKTIRQNKIRPQNQNGSCQIARRAKNKR